MTDKVQKIREEVERLKEETSIGLSEHENGVEQGRMEIINALSLFIDSMQEEPTSVWHDAIETPEIHRKFLARFADGKINGSWERNDDGFIPWKEVVREHKITHWCYVDDLLKL